MPVAFLTSVPAPQRAAVDKHLAAFDAAIVNAPAPVKQAATVFLDQTVAQAQAAGMNWNGILALIPQAIALIQALIVAIKGTPTAPPAA